MTIQLAGYILKAKNPNARRHFNAKVLKICIVISASLRKILLSVNGKICKNHCLS